MSSYPGQSEASIEAERQVVRTLLLSDKAIHAVYTVQGLRAEHFYNVRLGLVYRAMVELDDETGGYDRVSVQARVERSGGEHVAATLDELETQIVARVYDLPRMAGVVRDAFLVRTATRTFSDLAGSIAENPRGTIERGIAALESITADASAKTAKRADQLVEESNAHTMSVSHDNDVTGVPFGFDRLDKLTGGFQAGSMWIVAARPGMGKSAFSAQGGTHAAKVGHPTALFSIEMGDLEIGRRLVAATGHIPSDVLRKGNPAEWVQRRMLSAGQHVDGIPLWIDTSTDLSVMDLRAKVRRLHAQHGLSLVIVDYIGLLRMEARQSKNDAVGEISRSLKVLAQDLGIVVVVVTQLNREVDKRGTTASAKRPQKSDLRDSGELEQNADGIIFLFREGYYDENVDRPDLCEVIVEKHRHGSPSSEGELLFTWDGPTMTFGTVGEERK